MLTQTSSFLSSFWEYYPARCSQEAIEALHAAGRYEALMFTPNGPAGAFALYVMPGSNLGRVFLNEFTCVPLPYWLMDR